MPPRKEPPEGHKGVAESVTIQCVSHKYQVTHLIPVADTFKRDWICDTFKAFWQFLTWKHRKKAFKMRGPLSRVDANVLPGSTPNTCC